MVLAFWFFGGCPSSNFKFILVSPIIWVTFQICYNFNFLRLVGCICRTCNFCVIQIKSSSRFIPSYGFVSSRSVKSMFRLLVIPLFSVSTIAFWRIFTSTSWYFFVICNNFLFFNFFVQWFCCNRWSSILVKFYSVPSLFIGMLMWFIGPFRCFVLVNTFTDLWVSLSSVSLGSAIFLISCCLRCPNLQTFAKCLFSPLCHVDFWAEYLWMAFQFCELQWKKIRWLGFSLGFALGLPVYLILCIGSSLISFSQLNIGFFGLVFSLPSIVCFLLYFFLLFLVRLNLFPFNNFSWR